LFLLFCALFLPLLLLLLLLLRLLRFLYLVTKSECKREMGKEKSPLQQEEDTELLVSVVTAFNCKVNKETGSAITRPLQDGCGAAQSRHNNNSCCCERGERRELGRWRLSSLPSQFPTTPFLRVSIAWVLRQAVGQCHEQASSSEQKAENKATICRLQKSFCFTHLD
jgi:hypothetical protein